MAPENVTMCHVHMVLCTNSIQSQSTDPPFNEAYEFNAINFPGETNESKGTMIRVDYLKKNPYPSHQMQKVHADADKPKKALYKIITDENANEKHVGYEVLLTTETEPV